MTTEPPPVCPDCRQRIRDELLAALRDEAGALLDQHATNKRLGRDANAEWCQRAAFGYLRASAVVRRVA